MVCFRVAPLCAAWLLSLAMSSPAPAQLPAAGGAKPIQPPAGLHRPASVPEDYVVTPFGYLHPSCVQTLARGEHLLPDGRVQHADGTAAVQARLCSYPRLSRRGQVVSAAAGRVQRAIEQPEINGWVENASIYTNAPGTAYGAILATWTVPAQPNRNDGQVLYFFPGLEDIGSGESILQPVLGWYSGQWTINSWNCCLNGIATNSGAVNVSPGDQIYGSVTSTCPVGTVTCAAWNVLTVDLDTGQSTTLANAPSDGQTFNWAFGGVLESYSVDRCGDYPADRSMRFDHVRLFDQNLQPVNHPAWSSGADAQDTPQCRYGVDASAHAVTVRY